MSQSLSILLAALTFSLFSSCDSPSKKTESASPQANEPKIFASNYPLSYFAQRISGSPERIYFPSITGDPAFWIPTPEDISKAQNCSPLFLNGANYEKWLGTVTLSKRRIVDTSASFRDQLITSNGAVTHQHGPVGDHSHSGTAFTTWIDLSQAAQQAQSIGEALIAKETNNSAKLERNLKTLVAELNHLDKTLTELSSSKPQIPLYASHPIYQYFARAYKLDILPMLWEPDIFPNEQQWQNLEKNLASHPAKWMIWESAPLEQSIQRLRNLGIRSVVFDPCANTPTSGDFISVMQQNVKNLRPVFTP